MMLSELTATMYSAPMFTFVPTVVRVKGSAAQIRNTLATEMIGASMKGIRSAPVGMMISFVINLTTSARFWKMPQGPTRLGPMRS